MTDKPLREAIARALYARRWGSVEGQDWLLEAENTRRLWREDADAAIAAIEAAGYRLHREHAFGPSFKKCSRCGVQFGSFARFASCDATLAARPRDAASTDKEE